MRNTHWVEWEDLKIGTRIKTGSPQDPAHADKTEGTIVKLFYGWVHDDDHIFHDLNSLRSYLKENPAAVGQYLDPGYTKDEFEDMLGSHWEKVVQIKLDNGELFCWFNQFYYEA
jgi:hypothetical protein